MTFSETLIYLKKKANEDVWWKQNMCLQKENMCKFKFMKYELL